MKQSTKPKTLKTLYKRANRVGGQLLSIEKMVRTKRSHEEILNLILAIEGSVHSLVNNHFDTIIRQYLASVLNDLSEEENLPPDLANFIDKVRQNFPDYELHDLPKIFYDLRQYNYRQAC